jgi:hypothetical protein
MRASAAITWFLLTAATASAQAPPTNPQPVPTQGTVRCAPVQPPGQGTGAAPPQQTTGQSREPLSDRLAQADGVMCPPVEVDRQMQKPPPEAGKTPVIPPPGAPGGDPTVRPK